MKRSRAGKVRAESDQVAFAKVTIHGACDWMRPTLYPGDIAVVSPASPIDNGDLAMVAFRIHGSITYSPHRVFFVDGVTVALCDDPQVQHVNLPVAWMIKIAAVDTRRNRHIPRPRPEVMKQIGLARAKAMIAAGEVKPPHGFWSLDPSRERSSVAECVGGAA